MQRMKHLYNRLLTEKGFTLDNELKSVDSKGYFVSLARTETTVPLNIFSFDVMVQIINEYKKTTHLIGAWIDNDLVYIDNSILVNDLATAINLALAYNQISIYDNVKKETIYILDSIEQSNKYELITS